MENVCTLWRRRLLMRGLFREDPVPCSGTWLRCDFDTGGLPTHEVTLRIRAETLVRYRLARHWSATGGADGLQRNTRRRVPNAVLLIDSRLALPSGIQLASWLSYSDRWPVNPVACGRDLELGSV
jgi:hypothetical protein